KGDAGAAIPLFESLAKEHPEDANIAYQLGQALHQKGDLAGAVEQFQRALTANGEMREAYYALATALKEEAPPRRSRPVKPPDVPRGDLSAATAAFRRAVEANPSDPDARYNLGAALWYSGNRTDARLQLE